MSPQNNSNDELSIYADWLEENGDAASSAELREDITKENRITAYWIYPMDINSGWGSDFDDESIGTEDHRGSVGSYVTRGNHPGAQSHAGVGSSIL